MDVVFFIVIILIICFIHMLIKPKYKVDTWGRDHVQKAEYDTETIHLDKHRPWPDNLKE